MDSLLPAQTALIKPSIFGVYYFCASFFSCKKVSSLKMPPINENLVAESSTFLQILIILLKSVFGFSIKCYLSNFLGYMLVDYRIL